MALSGVLGSARLRKVVFEDEIDSPMGKQEKRMVKKLKKSMAVGFASSVHFRS